MIEKKLPERLGPVQLEGHREVMVGQVCGVCGLVWEAPPDLDQHGCPVRRTKFLEETIRSTASDVSWSASTVSREWLRNTLDVEPGDTAGIKLNTDFATRIDGLKVVNAADVWLSYAAVGSKVLFSRNGVACGPCIWPPGHELSVVLYNYGLATVCARIEIAIRRLPGGPVGPVLKKTHKRKKWSV